MGKFDLSIRFTENKYCTKNEVSKELKMSLIDNIWSNVLSYRSAFYNYLPIKSASKSQIFICECDSIKNLVTNAHLKIDELFEKYIQLSDEGKTKFEEESKINILKQIADHNQINVSDEELLDIVHGANVDFNSNKQILVRYLECLNFVKNESQSNIDFDFLAPLFQKINGISEITKFYRTEEDRNIENRAVVDRLYTCAPVNYIDEMMTNLISYINRDTDEKNVYTHALLMYYYISYVRPFSRFNEEIGILMAKAILSHYGFDKVAIYLPLENFCGEYHNALNKNFTESIKTNDFTYFLSQTSEYFLKKLNESLDDIEVINVNLVKEDLYKIDETKSTVEENRIETPVESIIEKNVKEKEVDSQPEVKEEPKIDALTSENIEKAPEIKEEENQIGTKIEDEKPTEQAVSQSHFDDNENIKVNAKQEKIAVSYIPTAIDEKTASRLENHLLETDPMLNRNQAKFFARHCTIGKIYTIAQFKKSIGCSYETARTSMEHLKDLGYYEKKQIKNKFVYTPIPR